MDIPSILKITQIGTDNDDAVDGIIFNADGDLLLTGTTQGTLFTENIGRDDIWVAKYNPSHQLIWAHQFGSDRRDEAKDITVDRDGNAYAIGGTSGNIIGTVKTGMQDPWIAKFDPDGNKLWTRQLTNGKQGLDIEAAQNGNIYISLEIARDSLLKYDTDGNKIWAVTTDRFQRTTGAILDTDENSYAVSPGTNRLSKYSVDGELLWQSDITASIIRSSPGRITAHDVTFDGDQSLYVVGRTPDSLDEQRTQGDDIWVAKYDTSGEQIWLRQFGSSEDEFADGITVDQQGQIYISGWTHGNLGASNAGRQDAFITQLDSDGNVLDLVQWGTERNDFAKFVRVGPTGTIAVNGWTEGTLGEASFGDRDGWFATFGSVTLQNGEVGISIDNGSVIDSSGDEFTIRFAVSLSCMSDEPVTVQYQTLDGSAIAQRDYESTTGMLTFEPGVTRQFVDVISWHDHYNAREKYFSLELLDVVHATITDTRGFGKIQHKAFWEPLEKKNPVAQRQVQDCEEPHEQASIPETPKDAPNDLETTDLIAEGTNTAQNDTSQSSINPDNDVSNDANNHEIPSDRLKSTDAVIDASDAKDGSSDSEVNVSDIENQSPEFLRVEAIAFASRPPRINFKQGDKGKVFKNNQTKWLRGTKDNDVLKGHRGLNRLDGGHGHDIVRGHREADRLRGNRGNDRLFARAGNDWLHGGKGDDVLHGGRGEDKLIGGVGNDVLIGQADNDILFGGPGNDVFVIRSLANVGQMGDIVRRFQLKDDILDMSRLLQSLGASNITTFADLQQWIQLEQVGRNTVIALDVSGSGTSFDQTLMTLQNTQSTALGPEHFVIPQ